MEMNENNRLAETNIGADVIGSSTLTIPVIHESVTVKKELIETGKVRISKVVNEENHLVEIPLEHEEIDVETIFINQFIESAPDPVRYEGDTMIIPVLKEVQVVRLMLEKEIRITKRKVNTISSQNVVLRKEDVSVKNFSSDEIQASQNL